MCVHQLVIVDISFLALPFGGAFLCVISAYPAQGFRAGISKRWQLLRNKLAIPTHDNTPPATHKNSALRGVNFTVQNEILL